MYVIKVNDNKYLQTFGYNQREPDEMLSLTSTIVESKKFKSIDKAEDFIFQHKDRRTFLKDNNVISLSIEAINTIPIKNIPCV
jgi:hypothetical protein